MLGPAGAPCAPAVPWAHPWAGAQHHGAPRRAHVAAEARCQKVPRLAGRAQRNPLATPLNACWRLAALPARATSGGGLSACARVAAGTACAQCKGKPRRWRGGDAALALSRSRCPIAALAHKPCRAARPLPLAAYRWPHLGGARPTGPVTGLGRLARPGLYNGPYSGLWPSAALARTRARLAGAIAASDKPAIAGCQSGGAAPSPPEPQRRRRALLLILIP